MRCPKCYNAPCTCHLLPSVAFTPPPPVNVVSLSNERFKRDTNPANHSPRAALERALEAFDALPSDQNYTHAIVMFAIKTDDGRCGTKFIQAGTADHHGQMGLIAECQCMLREAE